MWLKELNLIKKHGLRIGDWTSGEMPIGAIIIIDSRNFLKFFQTLCNQAKLIGFEYFEGFYEILKTFQQVYDLYISLCIISITAEVIKVL